MEYLTIPNITLFLAIWGALLSTLKVISDYRKSGYRLEVKASYGVMAGLDSAQKIVTLTAINISNRDITLNSMGFVLPDERNLFTFNAQSTVKFPYTLPAGNQCFIWYSWKQFAKELKEVGFSGEVKLKGFYTSAIGKTYKSKEFTFDTEIS